MGEIDLDLLYVKYDSYYDPLVRIMVGELNIEAEQKYPVVVTNLTVEVTSSFKASIAEFTLSQSYDKNTGAFFSRGLKKYIAMGSVVTIYMGHANNVTEVFKGFIASVNFVHDIYHEETSGIRITAMDVKGIMMANHYSKRLKANYFSDAVKEILDQQVYQNLKSSEGITSITVNDTPDKPEGGGEGGEEPDNRIEMVAESDYDFVIKAAKKFNYEFFTIGGNITFRKAKANTQELGEIVPHKSIISYDIGYDITGVVGQVVVRTLDIGKASKVEVTKKNTNNFSLGSKAKPLIADQSYVYIDSAIESQKDAESRAEYILEETSYRLGSLRMTFKGIPELVPGRFIVLKDFGEGASNKFYITDVTHEYTGFNYTTTIYGKASTL